MNNTPPTGRPPLPPLSPDRTIRYSDGWKYRLEAPYVHKLPFMLLDNPPTVKGNEYVSLTSEGVLTVSRGYCWDGASGPTFDTCASKRPSLVHDALYQLIREGILPPTAKALADDEFYRLCKEDGMWALRARVWWRGLQLGGAAATRADAIKPIKVAPCNGGHD